ncbi:hypothetical protein P7C71_g2212, partial [Lecanoromycetidae sp. Uapishka_2]
MVIVARMIAKFNTYYADKPVLTIMVTNAVLGGIADTVAQSLTAIRSKSRRNLAANKDISDGIEMPEYDEKSPYTTEFMIPHRTPGPPPFDFERLTRFMSLSDHETERDGAGVTEGLAMFFTFMTVTEGGGRRAVARKFQDVYLPALKANFMLWPVVQILNFRVIPLQFQIPFVSTVGIAWTAYLSLTNSSDEPL